MAFNGKSMNSNQNIHWKKFWKEVPLKKGVLYSVAKMHER